MTQRYMRKCNHILLVAPIGRVQTDNLVQKRLVDCHRALGSEKGLVCTFTDVSLSS